MIFVTETQQISNKYYDMISNVLIHVMKDSFITSAGGGGQWPTSRPGPHYPGKRNPVSFE